MTKITDLKFDSENARRRTERSSKMISDSLKEVGAARSIVIDEDGVILAGNGTVQAANTIGMQNVQIVDTDGDTIIAVRRSGLTPEQKKQLAYFDNRTAELAEWDAERIAADINAGVDLSALWNQAEIDKLMIESVTPNFDPTNEDEQGRLDQKKPITCPECGHEFTI